MLSALLLVLGHGLPPGPVVSASAVQVADDRAPTLLEEVDAGRRPNVAAVDDALRRASTGWIDELAAGCRERLTARDPSIRVAAGALLESITGFPGREQVQAAAGRGEWGTDPLGACRRALHVACELGDGGSLVPAVQLAGYTRGRVPVVTLTPMLIRTVVSVLDRDGDAARAFVEAYDVAHESLATVLVDALRARGTVEDLRTAHSLLGRRAALDAVVLNRMQVLCRAGSPGFDGAELERVRAYLSSPDERSRAAAPGVVARLDDVESIPFLIAGLADEAGTVRGPSHDALRQLTNLSFGPSVARWRHWYRFESSWWADRGQALVEGLRSMEDVRLLETLNELTAHALYRRRIGPAVEPLLEHRDETVVRMALSVLEATRCQAQVPAIRERLDDPRADVADQARRVLVSLTGRSGRSRRPAAQRRSSQRSTRGARGG